MMSLAFGQSNKEGVRPAYIEDGDTIYVEFLHEVEITAPIIFSSKKNAKRYSRLVWYVKKVYPYAKIAGIKMREYETILAQTKRKKDQRKIMRNAEAEIKDEFENKMKNLTYMQGEILLKLIDRETDTSSYALVKSLRGSFKAGFYQSFARIFGYNLKDRYDPEGRDKEIEQIVQLIEQGKI
jgi:hypothetical protein